MSDLIGRNLKEDLGRFERKLFKSNWKSATMLGFGSLMRNHNTVDYAQQVVTRVLRGDRSHLVTKNAVVPKVTYGFKAIQRNFVEFSNVFELSGRDAELAQEKGYADEDILNAEVEMVKNLLLNWDEFLLFGIVPTAGGGTLTNPNAFFQNKQGGVAHLGSEKTSSMDSGSKWGGMIKALVDAAYNDDIDAIFMGSNLLKRLKSFDADHHSNIPLIEDFRTIVGVSGQVGQEPTGRIYFHKALDVDANHSKIMVFNSSSNKVELPIGKNPEAVYKQNVYDRDSATVYFQDKWRTIIAAQEFAQQNVMAEMTIEIDD
jgi:hypothetical protein